MVVRGMADKQIARELGISVKIVENYVGSILRKTGAEPDHARGHDRGRGRPRASLGVADRAGTASVPACPRFSQPG